MTLVLLAHLATASITLLLCILAWLQPTHKIKIVFRVLTALSLGSGIILAIEPGHLNPAFCAKLGVYVLIIILTELKLRSQLKRSHLLQSLMHD